MDPFIWVSVLILVSWFLLLVIVSNRSARMGRWGRQPPGPHPLPVIGNLLQLGNLPHRSLAHLASAHGPLMSLRLGQVPLVVVSSPFVAKQVLHSYDNVLSQRAPADSLRALHHSEMSVAWMPPGAAWRRLRRLCNANLFTPHRLDANWGLRSRKVRELVSFVGECARERRAIDVGQTAFTTMLNLLSNTVFSMDVVDHREESSAEFKVLIRRIFEEVGRPNIADYFPFLQWADPQGRRRSMEHHLQDLHKLFDKLIEGRINFRHAKDGEDMLDVLLHSLARSELNQGEIKPLLVDLFTAGSDTSSTIVEWAMVELLCNPSAMSNVRLELDTVMKDYGREVTLVGETDIGRLPYIQAVMKETLRLHPPAPFLLPRLAGATVEISVEEGKTYTVSEGTNIWVNCWAIGRDPNVWGPDADEFLPEKFLEGDGKIVGMSYKGSNMEYLPFGGGRRICPGLPLAEKMVPLILANLLWCFEWALPEGMLPSDMDKTEAFGLTLCKAKPLLAIPRPRLD